MHAAMNDPLHGKTLKSILEALVETYEWTGLAERINVKCFSIDPSVASSLTFLRKTPWARQKVEGLYLEMLRRNERGDAGHGKLRIF